MHALLGHFSSEVLTDVYDVPIPAALATGDYHLYTGLYEPENFNRPLVTYQGEPQPDNRLFLTTVTVE